MIAAAAAAGTSSSPAAASKKSLHDPVARKALVEKLKARNGKLPEGFRPSFTPFKISLPLTCAHVPREYCNSNKLFSCSACDQFRPLMKDDGTYKGKEQHEFSRKYACQCPNFEVVLRLTEKSLERYDPPPRAAAEAIDDDEDKEMTSPGSDSQSSSQASSLFSFETTASSRSLRKRKEADYVVPDSSDSESDKDHHFERLVCQIVSKPPAGRKKGRVAIVTNSQETQTDILYKTQETQTDIVEEPPVLELEEEQPVAIMESISRWSRRTGATLELQLKRAIDDEESKVLRKCTRKERRINLNMLCKAMMALVNFAYLKRQLKTRCHTIVLCIFRHLREWKPDFFHEALLVESRQYLRRHVFQPWKFQKSIDTNAAGGLNYESCNSIRKDVEELGKKSIGVIPHGTTIAKYAKLLENHAVEKFGLAIDVAKTDHGPSLSFDLDNLLRLIIGGYGLDKYAATGSGHPPVMIAHTLDGAMLTAHLGHVTAGIKIVDPRAKNPLTDLPIGMDLLFQSRDLCFPAQIVFGKDCKQLYKDCFGQLHSRFHGGLCIPATVDCPELSNFRVISPQDMSSIWKTTGLGGGCYNKKQFCYACMCTNDLIAVPKVGNNRCDMCHRLGIQSCFCHPVNDDIHLQSMAKLLEEHVQVALDDGFQKLDYIASKSVINTNPHTANKHNNKHHIDFVPKTDSEVTKFNELLKSELKLRFKDDRNGYQAALDGNYNDRRYKLSLLVANEAKIQLARNTLSRSQVRDIAENVLAEEAVPCILHWK
jgi:hypothetical protein